MEVKNLSQRNHNDLLDAIDGDHLLYVEDGIVKRKNKLEYFELPSTKINVLEDVLIVFEYFARTQPKAGFVSCIEIPALSRIIKKHVFSDRISMKKATSIAIFFKKCWSIQEGLRLF